MPIRILWELTCDGCGRTETHVTIEHPRAQFKRPEAWVSLHRNTSDAWLCPDCAIVYGAFWSQDEHAP